MESPNECPSIHGYFARYHRYAQTLILEISQSISAVNPAVAGSHAPAQSPGSST